MMFATVDAGRVEEKSGTEPRRVTAAARNTSMSRVFGRRERLRQCLIAAGAETCRITNCSR